MTPEMKFLKMCKFRQQNYRCVREIGHEGCHRLKPESVYFDKRGNYVGLGP